MKTLDQEIKVYAPSLKLERTLSRRAQTFFRNLFFTIFVLGGAATVVVTQFGPDTYATELLAVSLIALALWLELMLLYAYHNSFYFRNLHSVITFGDNATSGTTYEVAQAVSKHHEDSTLAFCTSAFGINVLLRSGITTQDMDLFLQGPRQKISAASIFLPDEEIFTFIGLGKYLYAHDVGFQNVFSQLGIQPETFLGSLRWVIGTYHEEKKAARWWGKDNLSKTTGLGREWSYGATFLLDKYSREISTSSIFSTMTRDSSFSEEKVTEIETTLVRAKGANVLLIGEAGVGKIDLVMEVKRRMETGESLHAIAGQHISVLDTNRLFAANPSKQDLEITLLQLFAEAAEAGNTIIVIENLSSFLREAEAVGVFIPELLDEFLATSLLHVIATDTPHNYHSYLEPLGAFARRFAEILITTPDVTATTRVLQPVAFANEVTHGVIFTYDALQTITTSADRYIVEGVMPDKAIELLIDIATAAQQVERVLINSDFVYEVVSEKTSVPAGPIKAEEKDLLLHLEDKLHEQVIGQERALSAIAKAMRRARAGIQASDKPIGSFLFLGPTGVGKTETAKALAKVFFGGEQKIQRLDMSEFSGNDALERLVGNANQSGVLSDLLREQPYCVLLLDEFEKAATAVHDLFLQILDEGIFTDGRGTKVNARNTMIIATSNAGSQLILRTVQQRKELAHITQEIINGIIQAGVFRPELINRFDNTIIFEPLTIGEQSQVASLMLGSLYQRIKDRGYDLQVSPELLEVLVEKGYSPEFGARPMLRVLQDVIEEKVAQKIISGEITRGQLITLAKGDFTEEELR